MTVVEQIEFDGLIMHDVGFVYHYRARPEYFGPLISHRDSPGVRYILLYGVPPDATVLQGACVQYEPAAWERNDNASD